MASGQPANVQAYLSKHKITQLFEDLTALLVKELPSAPVDFLIQKLQARKKKASTATSTRIPTSPATKKKTLSVTGTGVGGASRPSGTAATTTARKPTQEIRKPAGSNGALAKPSGSRTAAAKTASPSKLRPPSDSKRPTTAPTRSGGGGGAAVPAGKRPTPALARSTQAGSRGSTSSLPPPGRGKRPASSTSTTAASGKAPVKRKPETGKAAPTKMAQKVPAAAKSQPAVVTATPPLPALSPDDTVDDSDVEQMTEIGIWQSEYDSYGDDDKEEEREKEAKEELDFNLLLAQMRRSKHPKRHSLKEHLTSLLERDTTSLGYVVKEEEEESEGESGLEMVEGASDLEEEGVVLSMESKHLAKKLPSAPLVSLQVIVCARCTRIISREDEASLITDSTTVQSARAPTDEFESVSQVDSHPSFPQWDAGLVSGSELTIHQKWMLSGKQSSDTLTSSTDTWKGITPKSRPLVPPSDEESELQLPTPINYQKEVEDEEETETGVGDSVEELSGTLPESSSTDTWKGITPKSHPLVPTSDEESELQLPTPVNYQKEVEDEEGTEIRVEGESVEQLSDTLVESSSTDTWKGITPLSHPVVPPSDEESELKLPTPVDYQKEMDEEEEILTGIEGESVD